MGDKVSDSESDGVRLPIPSAGLVKAALCIPEGVSPFLQGSMCPTGVSISGLTPHPRQNPASEW